VYTELFGVADSSAAFGVGMTRTIGQGDPESFSANRKAATHFAALRRGWKPRPFKTISNAFKTAVRSGLRAIEILLFSAVC
jgi:hypothetical protein